MATIEERLALIEYEHAELKKTTELQTIAIGALVNKATLERLNEKNNAIFDALLAHDRFTNEQLAEIRDQQIEANGKIVGLQTEMRQRFEQQETTMNARFEQQETTMNARFEQIMLLLTSLVPKPEQEK